MGRELAAPGPDVDDDTDRTVGEREESAGEHGPGGTVRGGREVRGRTTAGDVETVAHGIQPLVPRVAPGNGIHVRRL
ncbi:hypothetical protein GCM10009868_09650 [Terrabacter aerolatus]|uniref:Uncharacterized protein n=1 Tax=Terrabacter aerolatus TaxID=422442 RepID=A0A512D539_9MICO|nr:hypothetical protein TAE01_33820 [Terrabacter aerolatus]